MTLVFEPWSSGGNGVCRALSFNFVEYSKGSEFGVWERLEWFKESEAV